MADQMTAGPMTMTASALRSLADPVSEGSPRNAAEHAALAAELRARLAAAARGGPERARERHAGRGKLLPRDRVDALTDPGSPFLELSPLAANGMYGDEAPAAGLIAGVGRVSGRECVVAEGVRVTDGARKSSAELDELAGAGLVRVVEVDPAGCSERPAYVAYTWPLRLSITLCHSACVR